MPRKRLLLRTTTSLPATALAVFAFAAPANAASCGSVDVVRARSGTEASAYHLRTDDVSCRGARRVVRLYLQTGLAPGLWKARRAQAVPGGFSLRWDWRVITFKVAG